MIKKNFILLSIFPEMFPGMLDFSLAGKARRKGLWDLDVINIRDFAEDNYKTVDDEAFGTDAGGLLMKPDIVGKALDNAIDSLGNKIKKIICMSSVGRILDQDYITTELLPEDNIIILCPRFEGVDRRVLDYYEIDEISIGDYILSGGEVSAMVLMDSVIRTIPGVVKNYDNVTKDSFSEGIDGLLEYPQYTRPQTWKNLEVPDILLSGDHKKIEDWKLKQSKLFTLRNRCNIMSEYLLSKKEKDD